MLKRFIQFKNFIIIIKEGSRNGKQEFFCNQYPRTDCLIHKHNDQRDHQPCRFFQIYAKNGWADRTTYFLAVMGGVGGVLHAVLSVFNVGFVTSFFMALAIIIIGPIVSAIFGSIVAASLFFVWKLMGSQETIETAFRCGAYATAITPLTTLFGIIPYLGTLLGLGWMA